MSVLLLVATLCTGAALAQLQVPCYGEGCINVTVYLGPRWGSRVVMVPRTSTARPEVDVEEYRPRHKPITRDGDFQVDFMDDESSGRTSTRRPFRTTQRFFSTTTHRPWIRWLNATRSWQSRTVPTNYPGVGVEVVTDEYDRGTVDLSWRGYTGEEVKQQLESLSGSELSRVTKLILDRNQLQQLPVLVFPVELEYGLQDLNMADNHFNPPYFTSYTRFELSRLGRLKTLNISRCSLKSVDMPNLPTLEVLDLSHNELFFLSSTLDRLQSLHSLFLQGNRISRISSLPLASLANLWVLDLSHNGLRGIDGEPLERLHALLTVKLDNNRLSSLPQLDFERTKIESLANNSWDCSCALLVALRWQNEQSLQNERCNLEDRSVTLHEMKTWPEEFEYLCGNGWWGHAKTSIARWYRRNIDMLRVMYKLVGLLILLSVILALLGMCKRPTNNNKPTEKRKSKGIPYNILDEHPVSFVSGPKIDV